MQVVKIQWLDASHSEECENLLEAKKLKPVVFATYGELIADGDSVIVASTTQADGCVYRDVHCVPKINVISMEVLSEI